MPRPGVLLVAALAACLTACGVSVSRVNERPDKYYQQKLSFRARITRTQQLSEAVVLEVADEHGARILVRATPPVDAEIGDWVHVEGVLVPEERIEGGTLYDLVVAEKVSRTRAPRFTNLL
jgi:hypothetical protein